MSSPVFRLFLAAHLLTAPAAALRAQQSDPTPRVAPPEGAPAPRVHPRVPAGDIDSLILEHMRVRHVPGIAACIVKQGRIAWEGYYGLADIPRNLPVTPANSFMLASISKTVTGTALMRLWEQGRFGLDDSVDGYLPFRVRNPRHPAVPITFRQLMCHVSSINDNWSMMPYFPGDTPLQLGWYLREYLTPGGSYYGSSNYLSVAPGRQAVYCNVAVALCGYLVETISGMPFDRYCRDSLFVPLEMTNTAWFLRDLDTTLVARPYTWTGSGYTDQGLFGYTDWPAGALRTTARSFGRFLLSHMGWGTWNGVRVLDSSTVALIRTPQFPAVNPGWGLIWYSVSIGGRIFWGHGGADYGVNTLMYIEEGGRYGALALANSNPATLSAVIGPLLAMAETLTVGVREQAERLPDGPWLEQNFPNPFNPSTTIRFALPRPAPVSLVFHNVLGEVVARIDRGVEEAGWHEFRFDAAGLASGVYLYTLRAGGAVQTKSMLLVR